MLQGTIWSWKTVGEEAFPSLVLCPMSLQSVRQISPWQHPSGYHCFVALKRIWATCGPNWMRPCQRHKGRVEKRSRCEGGCFATKLDFPVIDHFRLDNPIEFQFRHGLLQKEERVWKLIEKAKISNLLKPGWGRWSSWYQDLLTMSVKNRARQSWDNSK